MQSEGNGLEAEIEFTPDGATTMVRAGVRFYNTGQWTPVEEFYLATADEDTMMQQATEFIEPWLERYGKIFLGHYLN